MSTKLTTLCWKLKLPMTEKVVLIRLADFAHHDGTSIYPSVGRVAEECGVSARAVQIAIRSMMKAGILIQMHAGGGRGRTSEYAIDLEVVERLLSGQSTNPEPPSGIKPANSEPPAGFNGVHYAGEKGEKGERHDINPEPRSPEPSRTVIEDNVSPSGLTAPEAPEDLSEILWALVPALMQVSGQKERAVWALMKQWRGQYGAALVVRVVSATIAEKRDKPVPWIIATLAERHRAAGGGFKPRVVTGGEDPRWPFRLEGYRKTGGWIGDWGPKPGQPNCRAPAHLVAEILGEPAA
jgi:hypothetical protein